MLSMTILFSACALENPPRFSIDPVKYADLIERSVSSPGYLIRPDAIRFYSLEFTLVKNHKAIAQSSAGAWGWSQGLVTQEFAIDQALENCRKGNRRHQIEQPCKIINVDGYWASVF